MIKFIADHPKWETEKPFNLTLPLPPDQPKTNSIYDSHDVQISDGRGIADSSSLDVHGFAFAELPLSDASLKDQDAIETEYLPQMETSLKRLLGAERVCAFDYAVSQY